MPSAKGQVLLKQSTETRAVYKLRGKPDASNDDGSDISGFLSQEAIRQLPYDPQIRHKTRSQL